MKMLTGVLLTLIILTAPQAIAAEQSSAGGGSSGAANAEGTAAIQVTGNRSTGAVNTEVEVPVTEKPGTSRVFSETGTSGTNRAFSGTQGSREY